MKALRVIPKYKLNTTAIMDTAEKIEGAITFYSMLKGFGYATTNKELLIFNSGGSHLRLKRSEIPVVIEELKEALEVMK